MRAASVLIKQMRSIADIDGANSALSCELRPVPSFKPAASNWPLGCLISLRSPTVDEHGGTVRWVSRMPHHPVYPEGLADTCLWTEP